MKQLFFGIILSLSLNAWAMVGRIDVARFSYGEMGGWQTKIFSGETHYSLQKVNGQLALQAVSNAAASGRYREIDIDLSKTPILHWSWKVNNTIPDINERTRSGDDYAARVYVVFSGGIAFWRTRAINYVWSSNQSISMHWPSAYTDNVRVIAVQSGQKRLSEWINERRNVRVDYRRLFGKEPGEINVVAIMTDTDNSGASAKAWYGDIWFGME